SAGGNSACAACSSAVVVTGVSSTRGEWTYQGYTTRKLCSTAWPSAAAASSSAPRSRKKLVLETACQCAAETAVAATSAAPASARSAAGRARGVSSAAAPPASS